MDVRIPPYWLAMVEADLLLNSVVSIFDHLLKGPEQNPSMDYRMAQPTKWVPAIMNYMKKIKLNISTGCQS